MGKSKKSKKRSPSSPNLDFEKKFWNENYRCVGSDEVGRGCLAGPVVTASVILPDELTKSGKVPKDSLWAKLNDSKLIKPELRQELSAFILDNAETQITWCYPKEIDRYNILHASMIAMRNSLKVFSKRAQVVLVDGHLSPFNKMFARSPEERGFNFSFQHVETIVKGDQKSLSIAAASIVAKVYRDNWMAELDQEFPGYDFKKHKGYNTSAHYKAIEKLGPCPIHRLSFSPFKEELEKSRGPVQEQFNW